MLNWSIICNTYTCTVSEWESRLHLHTTKEGFWTTTYSNIDFFNNSFWSFWIVLLWWGWFKGWLGSNPLECPSSSYTVCIWHVWGRHRIQFLHLNRIDSEYNSDCKCLTNPDIGLECRMQPTFILVSFWRKLMDFKGIGLGTGHNIVDHHHHQYQYWAV